MPTRKVADLPVQEREVQDGSWDKDRSKTGIDRIVIHTTAGTAESATNWFNNSANTEKTSAHYIVTLEGKYIHLVDEDNVAYHAGNYPMNQRSIGIEHEDNGKPDEPRTDALYTASAKLVKDIALFYDIPLNRAHILKHSEVINTPCPHTLDIDRIIREAKVLAENTVLKVKVITPKGLRLRSSPAVNNTNILSTVKNNTQFKVVNKATGDSVDNNNVWYEVEGGYLWSGGVEVTKEEKPKEEVKPAPVNWEEVAKEAIKQRDEALELIRVVNSATSKFLMTEDKQDKKSWWDLILEKLRIIK